MFDIPKPKFEMFDDVYWIERDYTTTPVRCECCGSTDKLYRQKWLIEEGTIYGISPCFDYNHAYNEFKGWDYECWQGFCYESPKDLEEEKVYRNHAEAQVAIRELYQKEDQRLKEIQGENSNKSCEPDVPR